MIVVDTKVLAARTLEHTKSALAGQVWRLDARWVVPPLWRYEFQNLLTKALWTKHLTLAAASAAWRGVAAALSNNELEPSPERVIDLAYHHRITGYDANFIALAMEMNLTLVTEDSKLHEKFPGLALSMQAFVDQPRDAGEVCQPQSPYRARRRPK